MVSLIVAEMAPRIENFDWLNAVRAYGIGLAVTISNSNCICEAEICAIVK